VSAPSAGPQRGADEARTLRHRFADLSRWFDEDDHPVVSTLLGVASLLVVFLPIREIFARVWSLPEAAYHQPMIATALWTRPDALLAWLLPAGLLAAGFRRVSWSALDAPLLRVLALAVAAILAWYTSCYPYNPYYAHPHWADRFAMLGLFFLAVRHPVFLVPLLALGTAIAHQFDHPLQNQSFTDKRPIFDVLALVLAYLMLRLPGLALRWERVLGLVLSLHAASYFVPGFGKLELAWMAENDIWDLTLAARENGWLAFLSPESMLRLESWMEWGGPLLMGSTLVLELGAPLLLLSRRLAIAGFVGLVGMHLGIFASSGILFLKWILLDALLVFVVFRLDAESRRRLFTWKWALLGMALAFCGRPLFGSTTLAWYDSGVEQVFRFEASGRSGELYQLPPTIFEPYDFPLAQGRYGYLSREPILVSTYGTSKDREAVQALRRAKVPADALRVVQEHGEIQYDPERIEWMRRFLQAYFGHENAAPGRRIFLERLAFPQHQWTGPMGDLPVYEGQEPIARVRVRLETVWLPLDARALLREETVLDMAIETAE
jgi:hypothetical protein